MRDFKKCSLEWESEIPSEWKEARLKDVLSKQNREILEGDQIVICSNQGKVTYRGEKNPGLVSMTENGYQGVNPGDLLIHGMDTWHGAIAVSEIRGKCTGVVHVCESHQSKRFIAYYLQSLAFRNVYKAFSNGVRQNTSDFRSWQKAGAIPIALPSLKEQTTIASYLDNKCAEIDKAIEAAEASIEDYKLYKKSVIFRAVTKGLDPDASMKDSGVEWIGEVPSGWKMLPLKTFCTIKTGDSDTQDEDPMGEYPLYVRSPVIHRSSHYTFEGEGILMAGDGAGAGRVFHFATGRYAVHQRVYRMSDFTGINPHFLFYYIRESFPNIMDQGSAQSTVPSVRLKMLATMPVMLPREELQEQIVQYLDAKVESIDMAIDAKRQIVEELKAYKKSLIWEAVTGKREVPCL